jgi:hypothetical protein
MAWSDSDAMERVGSSPVKSRIEIRLLVDRKRAGSFGPIVGQEWNVFDPVPVLDQRLSSRKWVRWMLGNKVVPESHNPMNIHRLCRDANPVKIGLCSMPLWWALADKCFSASG